MDATGMTLEGFFLQDYQRLQAENMDLRYQVEKSSREQTYGIFDLGEPAEMVKVSVASSYYFTGDYGLKKYTSAGIEKILAKSNADLLNWSKSFKLGTWGGPLPIEIQEKRYRYTVEIKDMDGVTRYAIDPRHSDAIVDIDYREPNMVDNLGFWMPAEIKKELEAVALEEVRSNLENARNEKLEEESAEE